MTLTARQRTKINAALSLIHDNGHDAKGVIGRANALMQKGQDARSAYEAALNDFIDREPALTPAISRTLKLVNASDDKTVDQYDAALSAYVSTGDESSLRALAPMIVEDSLALAVRDGEITSQEAANGDLSKALGFEPGEALIEAVATRSEQPSNEQPEPQKWHWQNPGQSEAPQVEKAPPAQTFTNGSQVALGGGPAGMIAPKAAERWARDAAAREAVHGSANGEGAESV